MKHLTPHTKKNPTPPRRSRSAAVVMYTRQRRILAALLSLIVLSALAYAYCISVSVGNIVLRKELELSIAQTHSRIGELEGEYLALKQEIDQDLARELGLSPVVATHYLDVRTAGDLTLNQ